MDATKESQQRKDFCDILFELAKSQDALQDAYCRSVFYKRFEALYDVDSEGKRFRHFYMDIFSVLTQIQQNSELGDINILGQNLDVIRGGYQPRNKSADGCRVVDVSDAINKLYDHVNLDIARIAYSDSADRKISGEASLENLQNQIGVLQQDLKKAQETQADLKDAEKKIINVERKLENAQKEYITILGIFASIVLAFTGGIAFSTSVLNNIANSSIYRIVSVAVIIGIVLVNTLFGLFHYINSLVSDRRRIFPLIISNIVLVSLLIAVFVAWNNGWVEDRNMKIKENQVSINTGCSSSLDE